MLRTIYVPLDGSECGERALPLAARIAQRTGAALELSHVHVPIVNVVMGNWQMGAVPIVDESIDADVQAQERDYLEAMRRRLADQSFEARATLLHGPIVETLLRHITETQADLVVMATHGRGAVSRVWLGSIADTFIRHSHLPTLLVPPVEAHAAAEEAEPLITIGLDGSPLAEEVLEPALEVGAALGASLTLLRVFQPLPEARLVADGELRALEQTYLRVRRGEAEAYLARLATTLKAQRQRVRTRVVCATEPARALLDCAADEGATMIALATHGRGGIRRLLLGSVADKVVRGSERPVLLLRPQGAEREPWGEPT